MSEMADQMELFENRHHTVTPDLNAVMAKSKPDCSTNYKLRSTCILLALVALLWILQRLLFGRRRRYGEPPLLPGIPFLGNALDFQRNSVELIHQSHKKYGPLFTLQLPFNCLHIVADVHAVEAFVKNRDLSFDPIQRMVNKNVFGFKLINANAIIREAAHSARCGYLGHLMLTYVNFLDESFNKEFSEISETSSAEWRTVALKEFISETQYRAIFNSIFGRSDDHSFNYINTRQNFETFHDSFIYLWLGFPLWIFPKAQAALNELVAAHPHSDDFLQRTDASDYIKKVLAKLIEEGGTQKEVLGHNLVFLHVNYNTIKITFWILCRLAAHPEAMIALREEINAFLADRETDNNGKVQITTSEVEALPVLDSIIRETFRLSSGVMMVREVIEDTELELPDGRTFKLRKGDKAAIYPPAIHKDPEIYAAPEEFRFNRFISATFYKDDQIVRNPLLPYGTRCPGQRMSMLQIKVFFLSFVARFDLEAERDEKIPELDLKQYGQEILPPVSDMNIRIRQRKDFVSGIKLTDG